MLVNVVGVKQLGGFEGGEQCLGDGFNQRLRVAALAKAGEAACGGAAPSDKEFCGSLVEGCELGMAEDGRLDLGQRQFEAGIAGAAGGFKQCGTHAGQHLPVGGQRVVGGIKVALGDAAAQVALNVLQVLRLGTVDVPWQIQVVVVLGPGNLVERHHAGVARGVGLPGEGVHDSVDVLLAQAVLVAVLDEGLGGIDHEHAPARRGVLLVEHQNAGRNAGAIKEVGRQTDDAFEDARAQQLLADHRFGIAAKQHAVRQDAGRFASALHGAEDVQQVGVVALLGGRLAPGKALEGVGARCEAGAPAFV